MVKMPHHGYPGPTFFWFAGDFREGNIHVANTEPQFYAENCRLYGCIFFCSWLPGSCFFRGYQTPRHRFGSDFLRCVISVVQGGLSFLSKERKGVRVSRRIPTAI